MAWQDIRCNAAGREVQVAAPTKGFLTLCPGNNVAFEQLSIMKEAN
jgi:hypothetical protein